MSNGRVVPWRDQSELEELKAWFYPKEADKGTVNDLRSKAIRRVKSYKIKGSQYLPHVIDSTAQLTSAMLADEDVGDKSEELHNLINMRMTYTMILIRFVNGLLDPSQQTQFAIPLHTIARRVGLPSWFVDLRHWGTHERDLPSIDMLRMAAKEALVWLWDNYWNNEELDEDEDDEDSEEASVDDQKIEELRRLIRNWKAKEDELEEYSYIWLKEGSGVITSKNFIGSESNNKSISELNSMPTMIEKYSTVFKQLWKGIKNHSLFIKAVIESYNKLLLGFLLRKLPNFDIEIISWIIDTTNQIYIEENKESYDNVALLTSRFPKWKKLENSLLHGLVRCINIKQRAEDIRACLDRGMPLTYPTSRLYYLLSDSIESELNNNNWRKKKRRKDGNDSTKTLSDISTQWKTLNKEYILSHDTLLEEKKYNTWKRTSNQTDAKESGKIPTDNTISSDLQQLKERLQKLKQKKQETDVMKLKTYNWEQHTDWEPKPIGTL